MAQDVSKPVMKSGKEAGVVHSMENSSIINDAWAVGNVGFVDQIDPIGWVLPIVSVNTLIEVAAESQRRCRCHGLHGGELLSQSM